MLIQEFAVERQGGGVQLDTASGQNFPQLLPKQAFEPA